MSFTLDPGAAQAIGLTLQLAATTTVVLLLVATPLAWWLSQTNSRWRTPIAALVTLPLVLPPTVLGFYLLVLLGPQGWVGMFTQWLGVGLLSFSFTGLLLGAIVCSLPFAVQPIQYAFEAMGRRPMEVAATLRARPWDAFFTVALPLAKPAPNLPCPCSTNERCAPAPAFCFCSHLRRSRKPCCRATSVPRRCLWWRS